MDHSFLSALMLLLLGLDSFGSLPIFVSVLLETFVECERHRGTSYKAASWTHVGKTAGRSKKSRVHQQINLIKDIWL